jgi:hypothetical protein
MRRIKALPLAALTLTALSACTTGGAATSTPASHSTGPVAHSAPSVTPSATPPTSQTPTRSAGPTVAPTPDGCSNIHRSDRAFRHPGGGDALPGQRL